MDIMVLVRLKTMWMHAIGFGWVGKILQRYGLVMSYSAGDDSGIVLMGISFVFVSQPVVFRSHCKDRSMVNGGNLKSLQRIGKSLHEFN